MIKVILYILSVMAILTVCLIYPLINNAYESLRGFELLYICCITGGLGGVTYCLRGVYLNASVRGDWDKKWEVWYYLRPFVSIISGGIAYVFLKAGLLVLEAQEAAGSSNYGFIALSFIAGLNVDNFIKKIESIAESAWGISKSRSSQNE